MKIEVTETFLDDRERFEAGKSYDVPDVLAARAVGNGWARAEGIEAGSTPQEVTLDIEPGRSRSRASSPGGGGGRG